MTEKDLIDALIAVKSVGGGFALILWGAFLVKKYVINGSVAKFFNLKRKEVRAMRRVESTVLSILKLQERFLLGVDKDDDNAKPL